MYKAAPLRFVESNLVGLEKSKKKTQCTKNEKCQYCKKKRTNIIQSKVIPRCVAKLTVHLTETRRQQEQLMNMISNFQSPVKYYGTTLSQLRAIQCHIKMLIMVYVLCVCVSKSLTPSTQAASQPAIQTLTKTHYVTALLFPYQQYLSIKTHSSHSH